MTNQEILTKAILKAANDSWKAPAYAMNLVTNHSQLAKLDGADVIEDASGFMAVNSIIYNHDFAKALWGYGEDLSSGLSNTIGLIPVPRWKDKLQQMVIADDPIKYLGENI